MALESNYLKILIRLLLVPLFYSEYKIKIISLINNWLFKPFNKIKFCFVSIEIYCLPLLRFMWQFLKENQFQIITI